jgi:hypothetical protein
MSTCPTDTFLSHWADYSTPDAFATHPDQWNSVGKRVPYIGWYWRECNFAAGDVSIGDCVSFTGFMQNNKWGHPERRMTRFECDMVQEFVREAKALNNGNDDMHRLTPAAEAKMREFWAWMQTLEVEA